MFPDFTAMKLCVRGPSRCLALQISRLYADRDGRSDCPGSYERVFPEPVSALGSVALEQGFSEISGRS